MSKMRENEENPIVHDINFLWFGLGFSMFYWILESVRDVFVFNRGSVIERIFLPDSMSFWMRFLVVCIIILFSARAQVIRRKMQEQAEKKPESGSMVRIVRVGLAFGILYWILESLRDAFVFGKGPLLERILTPEPMGIWIRLLAIFVLMLFSAYAQSIINTQRRIENALRAKHEKLEKEVKNRTAELVQSKDLLEQEKADKKRMERELQQAQIKLKAVNEEKRAIVNVDRVKNRVYVKLNGALTVNDALRLKQDYHYAVSKCQPGFDVLNDVEELKPCSPEVVQILSEISQIAAAAGVGRVVRIEGDTPIAAMQIDRVSRSESKYAARHFKTYQEALHFLDHPNA
jgi:hypothetical protein